MNKWVKVHGLGTPVMVNLDNVATVQRQNNDNGNNAVIRFIGETQNYTTDESFSEVMEMIWQSEN